MNASGLCYQNCVDPDLLIEGTVSGLAEPVRLQEEKVRHMELLETGAEALRV